MTKNHSPEYTGYIRSNIWYARCATRPQATKKFQKATGNRCVLFPWQKSNHAHHLTYCNLQAEKFIRDCVPLSKKAHEIIHHPVFWKNKSNRSFINGYLRFMASILWLFAAIFGGNKKWKE